VTVRSPLTAILVRNVLAEDGRIPWASLLEAVVPIERQRELCRAHGLTPKGGFRLEKAPTKVLSKLLAEQRDAALLEKLASAAVEEMRGLSGGGEEDGVPAPEARPVAAQEAEFRAKVDRLTRFHAEAVSERDRARDAAARQRARAEATERRLSEAEETEILLRSQVTALERQIAEGPAPTVQGTDRAVARRIHELERELETLQEAEAALRRRLALSRTVEREQQEQLAELEALLPKGKRRRRRVEEPPEPTKRFYVPHLSAAFYKSLEGKERRSVERAIQAILLYCTEGPAYPGLEVKQLGGQDLWSMRASLKLRIYFRQRTDGDIDVLALGDREDQPTTLRRLKES